MKAFLEERQRVMSVGEDVGLAAQVPRGFREARQHVLEKQLKALLGEGQQGSQRDDLGFDLGIEGAQRAPGRFRDRASPGTRSLSHRNPCYMREIPQP